MVNINGIKNKLEELKLLIHDTNTDIITIPETKLIPLANTPKVHNFTTVRTDKLHNSHAENTHATQTTVPASQSPQQPHAQHRVSQPAHGQTKDYHRTTNTTQAHIYNSKSEINLIIMVNINGIKNKLEELKLLIHDTNTDIITIQETKLIPLANTPKVHNFTTVLHKTGGGLITLTHYIHYNRHSFNNEYIQHRSSNGQCTH